jgi:NADH-quinone oxidoreductase subunit L
LGGFYRATLNKFYIDEVWMFITQNVVFKYISMPIAWFDRHIVDGTMDGIGWTTEKLASSVRIIQSGKVQFYAWIFVIGTLLITIWALFM